MSRRNSATESTSSPPRQRRNAIVDPVFDERAGRERLLARIPIPQRATRRAPTGRPRGAPSGTGDRQSSFTWSGEPATFNPLASQDPAGPVSRTGSGPFSGLHTHEFECTPDPSLFSRINGFNIQGEVMDQIELILPWERVEEQGCYRRTNGVLEHRMGHHEGGWGRVDVEEQDLPTQGQPLTYEGWVVLQRLGWRMRGSKERLNVVAGQVAEMLWSELGR